MPSVRPEDDDRTELLIEFFMRLYRRGGVGVTGVGDYLLLLGRSRKEMGRVEHARLERVGERVDGGLPFPGK